MNDPDISHQIGNLSVREIPRKTKAVHGPQRFDAPQAAAIGLVPFSPKRERVRLMEKHSQGHGGIEIDGHLRWRSSKSILTAETDRLGFIPFSLRRSFTGRVGSLGWELGADAGRIRATRCRWDVTTTSPPCFTSPR